MQVFVPYPSPIDVAKCLDPKRLRKQIIECDQILAAIEGRSEAWKNHSVVKMYGPYIYWLRCYRACLLRFAEGTSDLAALWSRRADSTRPPFLTDSLCDQHKRRLYAKAPELYAQFAEYGKSDENWYIIDGQLVKYIKGKRVE